MSLFHELSSIEHYHGIQVLALKISGSAGIPSLRSGRALPAFRAAIVRKLRAGCPRSRVLHGFCVPLVAWATALKTRRGRACPTRLIRGRQAVPLQEGSRQRRGGGLRWATSGSGRSWEADSNSTSSRTSAGKNLASAAMVVG